MFLDLQVEEHKHGGLEKYLNSYKQKNGLFCDLRRTPGLKVRATVRTFQTIVVGYNGGALPVEWLQKLALKGD